MNDDGEDTNLDDIDDDDEAVRPTVATCPPLEMIRVLSGLDALRTGDIKLLRLSWLRRLLRQPNGRRLNRQQELEALFLASGEKSPFLSAEEAVALLRRGPAHPRLAVTRRVRDARRPLGAPAHRGRLLGLRLALPSRAKARSHSKLITC